MSFSKRANTLLQKIFNLKIVRADYFNVSASTRKMNSHSYLVEFVGTSGVGKTTLCNYFLKKRSKELAVTSKLKIFSKKDIILSPEPNNNLDEIYELLFLKKT